MGHFIINYKLKREGNYSNGEETYYFLSENGELATLTIDYMPDEEVIERIFGEDIKR